jgi:hypothetical protein
MSEPEDGKDEVQILEPPPIIVLDLVSEAEIEPPQTLLERGLEPILISDGLDHNGEMLVERDRIVKVWENGEGQLGEQEAKRG